MSIRNRHPSQTTASDYGSGLLRTLDGYSGWLLRTTPDYSGWLRRPQGFSVPSPRASLALGKLPTRLPVSPVLVLSTSMIAELGRDSLIYNGGGSSLWWSVPDSMLPLAHRRPIVGPSSAPSVGHRRQPTAAHRWHDQLIDRSTACRRQIKLILNIYILLLS